MVQKEVEISKTNDGLIEKITIMCEMIWILDSGFVVGITVSGTGLCLRRKSAISMQKDEHKHLLL